MNTCSNFPKFTGTNSPKFPFKPVSTDQVLAGRSREYVCKNSARIPLFKDNTTGAFQIKCLEDGKFEVSQSNTAANSPAKIISV